MTRRETKPGTFYGIEADGSLVETGPGIPDVWVCRRIADYPAQRAPAGAALGVCARCTAPIAFSVARLLTVPLDTPRVCMQCAGIEPTPII